MVMNSFAMSNLQAERVRRVEVENPRPGDAGRAVEAPKSRDRAKRSRGRDRGDATTNF